MDSDPLDLGRIQQATGHMTHNQPEQQQQTQQQQRQDPSSATPPATPSEDSAPSLSISLAPLEQPAHHFFQWKSPVVGMMPGNISKLNYSPNSLNASPQSSADKRPSPDSTPQMPPWVTARDAPGMMMRQPPPSFPPTPAGFLDLQNNNNNKQNMSSLMEESLLFMDPGTLHPSEDARHMNTTDHPMGPWYAGLMDGHSSSANLQKVEEQSSSTRPISRPINVPVSQQQWMPGSAPMSSQMAGSPQLHHGQTQVGPKSFASMSMDPQWYYQWQLFQQQQQQQQQQLFHQVKRGPGSQVAPQPTHFPLPAPFLMRGQSVPRFICHINNCGKTFTTKQSLKSHAPTHAVEREKPFACSICGSAFRRKHDLARHHRSLHAIVKPFKCQFCGKEYARSDALKRHLQSKAHNLPESLTYAVIAASRQTPFPSYIPSTMGDLSGEPPPCPEDDGDLVTFAAEVTS